MSNIHLIKKLNTVAKKKKNINWLGAVRHLNSYSSKEIAISWCKCAKIYTTANICKSATKHKWNH